MHSSIEPASREDLDLNDVVLAIRHIPQLYVAVGEYGSGVDEALEHFLKATDCNLMLFDTGLHYSFASAGREAKAYDLRTLFDKSWVKDHPAMASRSHHNCATP